jgi:hypothetical protein
VVHVSGLAERAMTLAAYRPPEYREAALAGARSASASYMALHLTSTRGEGSAAAQSTVGVPPRALTARK